MWSTINIAKDINLHRLIYLGKERVHIPKWYYYMMALPLRASSNSKPTTVKIGIATC
jgi:hypothetical protein